MSAPQARYDLYGPVHKGLRRAMTDMLVRLGAADFNDDDARRRLLDDLTALLEVSRSHILHEEQHIHAALEAHDHRVVSDAAHAHDHHRDSFETLEALIADATLAEPAARPAAARALYLAFSVFVADDLAHMAHEEQVMQPILHARFTDAELAALEGAILADLSPAESMLFMRMMLPAVSPDERFAMLSGMRAAAPAPAFEAVMQQAARPALDDAQWEELTRRLAA
jgi:hypothetical protein